jgi:hypothetical protein
MLVAVVVVPTTKQEALAAQAVGVMALCLLLQIIAPGQQTLVVAAVVVAEHLSMAQAVQVLL